MAAATAQALPIVFVALRARLHRGLALWGLGLVVNALSYPAFGLRAFGWTEVSILATNLLSGLTLVLHTLVSRRFSGTARSLCARRWCGCRSPSTWWWCCGSCGTTIGATSWSPASRA